MNTEQPEPLAAILAEMRDGIHTGRADIIDYVNDRLRSYADRIEAAAERERDEDRQLAAIAESDEAFARCARCDRPERVPGNASSCAPMSLEEAIEHAESRADETPCGQAHAQLAGWLRELRDLRNAPGNAAALSTPARNCDRFATELDARLAWKREAHCKGDYRYWLFAPAEGSDNA